MASDLENLIETIEKLSIEPVYNTNWCHMPAEIKLECIGKMELKERLSLRCTAKAEKSLVDSQKIKFDYGHFWGDEEGLGFDKTFEHYEDSNKVFNKKMKDTDEGLKIVNYIKKVGVFERLRISFENPLTDNEHFFTDDRLLTVKKVEFVYCNIDNAIAVLRKVKNGVESIGIGLTKDIFDDISAILEIPQVQNVPHWDIYAYKGIDCLHKVAQMWIDKSSKIGTTFETSAYTDSPLEEFLEHCADRIVSKSEKRVRVRTNNPDRHILLERGLDETGEINYIDQYFTLIVISSEMKESECDNYYKKYKYPEVYDEYDSEDSIDDYDYEDYHGYEW
ncbi:unnamed protein product [Caenorhabditis nigoni]